MHAKMVGCVNVRPEGWEGAALCLAQGRTPVRRTRATATATHFPERWPHWSFAALGSLRSWRGWKNAALCVCQDCAPVRGANAMVCLRRRGRFAPAGVGGRCAVPGPLRVSRQQLLAVFSSRRPGSPNCSSTLLSTNSGSSGFSGFYRIFERFLDTRSGFSGVCRIF